MIEEQSKLVHTFILIIAKPMTEAEKTTFTADELEAAKQEALNKYKSDQEQGIQKLVKEKKFAETVLDAV
jgi:hypothetical protein